MEKQMDERERIEDEMLAEGDKLIDFQLKKERKEMEKEEAENETEIDEGKVYELEEELDNICVEINNISEELDSKDQTLEFINRKINEYAEELQGMDVDIEPLNFKGLQSVDAARITLQTFFSVLLDLNVYKRDLEQKCIEQDEAILALNDRIRILHNRIEDFQVNGVNSLGNQDVPAKTTNVHKEKALKNIVESLDGYVAY
mmetsp:Transcript_35035/g.34046  ORF Transcript_35035/g.34046 Transcript_35035/m.34046 type:complete len:202 (+) Transcript_35035:2836-3441(+)